MYEVKMRAGRCSTVLTFLLLLAALVAARPIYPPSHPRRVLGRLVAREGWDSHARIGEPVFVTFTVPGGGPTTACLQMTGSSLDVCSEELPSPTTTVDTPTQTEVPPVVSTELPVPTPEPETGEIPPAMPCDSDLPPPNRDPSASTSTTPDAIPSETRFVVTGPTPSVVDDPSTVIPPPALPTLPPVEQEPTTTIHIFTTITEFIIPTPTAQPPDPDPPSSIPTPPSVPENMPFPPLPTPEGQFTSPEESGSEEPAMGIDIVPV